ncbi:PIN domain-containing protein [Microcoleus sp. LEGE 07076]|uniref:PIN domain-containing protein n=1 Tax=Microcoleus sp. LEGE 07076 TaxID=915322 RepID=UPI001D147B64|nr:PIN domain-containing protein [Microcoleus sp. LEGE 07076]
MKVLFDTNVLLDAMLAREPFVADAAFLLNAVESGRVEGFMSATTVTDVHYLVGRQTKSSEAAIAAVTRLLALMEICAVDREILEQAIGLGLPDFEDAVQIACDRVRVRGDRYSGCEWIRRVADFRFVASRTEKSV